MGSYHKFTKGEIQFISDNVKGISLQELTDRFNKKFGTNLNPCSIQGVKNRFNLKSEYHPYRFKPGMKPIVQQKRCPVGTITDWEARGLYIKIKDPNTWIQYSHYIYEKYHNLKLNKNDAIVFIDGDKYNFDKDNLARLSFIENMNLNRMGGIDSNNKELNLARINIAKIQRILSEVKKN